jgi:ATP-binding cassette subfamily F protein 3
MLQLKNVIKDFGGRRLFADVNLHIRPKDRIGLCGENGAGKTTLLKVLAGRESIDAGSLQAAKGTSFGYLPQEGLEHRGRTLFAEVRTALSALLTLEQELQQIEAQLDHSNDEALLHRYAEAQEQFQQGGGYTIEAEVGKVLRGLGFVERDWQKPCETFSGGWQMRIALAKLLLQRPNLLLLDEPTNHLDLPARDWLESYLQDYPYAIVLVSHDRFFLDQVVNRIVEVWNGGLSEYPGNYSRYLETREQRIGALREEKRRQDEEIERTEAFINRFRYQANKASLVQSRIKQLEKVERIELPPQRRRIAFRFADPPKGGRQVLALEKASQRYGELAVLDCIDLQVERGERLALVGPNGAGKSTLMRLLAGVEMPTSGTRSEGHNLHLAYFAQDQARELPAEKTVLQAITDAAPFAMVPKVRDILGSFLFSGDDVEKKVRVLSGGERNRLALAILLLRPANLLLLDEPTNHLDLLSKEVLLDALRHFSGTLVFVSHDRYFVDHLATRVIEVGEGRATSWFGNYADFLRAKAATGDASHSSERVEQRTQKPTSTVTPPLVADDPESRREAKREQRRRQKELQQIEERIAVLEGEQSRLEDALADPAVTADHGRLAELTLLFESVQGELEPLYLRWEQLGLAESA